jgi:predicted XRE-type DNA-binding protein
MSKARRLGGFNECSRELSAHYAVSLVRLERRRGCRLLSHCLQELAFDGIVKERRLKQIEVAHLLGIRQPDVSKMLRGQFRQFSVERLMRFLVALNQDVEIVVKPHRDRSNALASHVS